MTRFSDKAVDAAAKAMFEERPKHTDPAHWEATWDEVPEAWKAGQRAAARRVLQAAAEAETTSA